MNINKQNDFEVVNYFPYHINTSPHLDHFNRYVASFQLRKREKIQFCRTKSRLS